MNWDQIEGKWTEIKGKAQQAWGALTDDDVDQIQGKRDEIVGKLQSRYGKAREEAEREVDNWASRL